MKNSKILQEKILSDDELDNVAGGTNVNLNLLEEFTKPRSIEDNPLLKANTSPESLLSNYKTK